MLIFFTNYDVISRSCSSRINEEFHRELLDIFFIVRRTYYRPKNTKMVEEFLWRSSFGCIIYREKNILEKEKQEDTGKLSIAKEPTTERRMNTIIL